MIKFKIVAVDSLIQLRDIDQYWGGVISVYSDDQSGCREDEFGIANDNFEDLKETITNLKKENLREIWSKQYDYISQNYSMDKVLQKWIYVYKNI